MPTWIDLAIFYQIYPLGLLGAPRRNEPGQAVTHQLWELAAWGPHIQSLGCNAVYLGPVFQSTSHGYDTVDYTTVDRRLGCNADLAALVAGFRELGIRVILDGVFNHVSRDFFAFRDLQERGEQSPHRDWFVDVDFGQRSPLGDPFSYYAYEGNFDLVKLNLANPEVKAYLFAAVRTWFAEFGVDGVRFDAVDVLDHEFVREICAVCRDANPDCWLMGEVVFGEYDEWLAPGMLDSCTNYAAYKGLWSSFNSRNMHEIAWTLNRQFGPEGLYRDALLYSFADNHDVNRIASQLARKRDLPLLYALMYTMPGVPSIYYGSEWGAIGKKRGPDDSGLRAAFDLVAMEADPPRPRLPGHLAQLAAIRDGSAAIRHGDYAQLYVASEQLAFRRRAGDDIAIVAVNASSKPMDLDIEAGVEDGMVVTDQLDESTSNTAQNGRLQIPMAPNSARIFTIPGSA